MHIGCVSLGQSLLWALVSLSAKWRHWHYIYHILFSVPPTSLSVLKILSMSSSYNHQRLFLFFMSSYAHERGHWLSLPRSTAQEWQCQHLNSSSSPSIHAVKKHKFNTPLGDVVKVKLINKCYHVEGAQGLRFSRC